MQTSLFRKIILTIVTIAITVIVLAAFGVI